MWSCCASIISGSSIGPAHGGASQHHGEQRQPDQGRENAQRQLHGERRARHVVEQQKVERPQQGGGGQHEAVVRAPDQPGDLRNQQADPGDHPGQSHRQRAQQGGQRDDPGARGAHRHAQCGRFLVAHAQHVERMAQADEGGGGQRHQRGGEPHAVRRHAGERAHQPIANGGQLVVRVGDILGGGQQRGEKRAGDQARQQQHHNAMDADQAGEQQGHAHGQQPKNKAGKLNLPKGVTEQDAQCRAECGSGQTAEHFRRGQRITKQRLVGRARGRQRGADAHGSDDARRAQLHDHRPQFGRMACKALPQAHGCLERRGLIAPEQQGDRGAEQQGRAQQPEAAFHGRPGNAASSRCGAADATDKDAGKDVGWGADKDKDTSGKTRRNSRCICSSWRSGRSSSGLNARRGTARCASRSASCRAHSSGVPTMARARLSLSSISAMGPRKPTFHCDCLLRRKAASHARAWRLAASPSSSIHSPRDSSASAGRCATMPQLMAWAS